MVSLTALWLPILLAAVVVFIASSFIHMALKYHNAEYRRVPDEDAVLGAMRAGKIAPGFYSFPHAASMKEMGSPELIEKFQQGPVGTAHIRPNGPPAMGASLVQWFIYCIVVGLFAGYLASRTLSPGTSYLQVFRVVGCASFMAYSLGYLSDGIWKMKPWSMTFKHVVDGLIYGLLTGGVFGWLWPQ
jgi:Flp pilus assembly protein TadB